jgi:ABC-2 type transport system permease protein
MSSEADTLPPAPADTVAVFPWTRTFYWSVRRELWEHRAIYLAPAAVGAFAVLIHFLTALTIPDAQRNAALVNRAVPSEFMGPYDAVSGVIVVTALLVGLLYCVGALHGERRDRSILFWKSLPVSDRVAVLSKAAIPGLVLPLILFVAVVAANVVMITLQSVVWTLQGFDPRALWARLDLPFLWLSLLYGLPFMVLWYAPLYAWMLFVSSWARRWPFLWGAAPLVAVLMVEHLALHHTPAHWLLERWLAGGVIQPYTRGGGGTVWIHRLADLEPVRLYTLPALWVGVVLAAVFLALTVRMRRSRGPI